MRSAEPEPALDEHPDWIAHGQRPVRLTLVWDACQDADCAEELAGVAFVRVMDARNESLGRVVVCIEENSAVIGSR
jgi:hypothetical protein